MLCPEIRCIIQLQWDFLRRRIKVENAFEPSKECFDVRILFFFAWLMSKDFSSFFLSNSLKYNSTADYPKELMM